MDAIEEEERKRRRRWIMILAALAILLGVLIGLALTRDTTHRSPGRDRRHARTRANERLEREGFKIGASPRGPERQPTGNGARAGPDSRGKGRLDCSFLDLLLLEAEGDADGQRRAGQRRRSRRPPACRRRRATETLEAAGFEVQVEPVNSAKVEEGLVIHSEPVRRHDRDPRLRRHPHRLRRARSWPRCRSWSASSAAIAVQQIRGRGFEPSVSEEPKALAEGPGDPADAERRQRDRARLDRLDRRLRRRRSRRRCRT